jgi:hypothetical protein
MGISTWISFGGINSHAIVHGEFGESPDDIRKVLRAMTLKDLSIESIRNHTAGEHPQYLFVRFFAEGNAIELAKEVRYVLDVEAGAIALPVRNEAPRSSIGQHMNLVKRFFRDLTQNRLRRGVFRGVE